MSRISDSLISVVVPIRRDWDGAEVFLGALHKTLSRIAADFEIVVIGTHSHVETESWLARLSSVRLIELSDDLQSHVMFAVGLENAIGDVVVLMNAEEDPVDILDAAIAGIDGGKDVLVGVSLNPRSARYRAVAKVFKWLFAEMIGYHVPSQATDFRALSRRAVQKILLRKMHRENVFVSISRSGYRSDSISYRPGTRAEGDQHTIRAGLRKALSILVFNSTTPLRIISFLGIVGSLAGVVISLYALTIYFVKENTVEGWTTLSLFMSFQFSLVFVILFVYGEYLARLIEERHEISHYDVVSERHSPLMLNENRRNIMSRSDVES